MKHLKQAKLLAGAVAMTVATMPQLTTATEGYFQHGWGARHSALAGAGTAYVTDASGQAHNPAGITNLEGSEINLSMTLFNPNRSYNGTGQPGFSSNGITESESDWFLVPNFAYSAKIDDNTSWGLTLYGNGGMNTDYPGFARPLPDCPPQGGNGIYCGGPLGVDLIQAFFAATYAKKFDSFSFGISPIFAFQSFEARGLAAFSGFSSDPSRFTNNDHDNSTGFGVKFGLDIEITDSINLALVHQTKIDMSEFDNYSGLFADGGDFDIPSNLTVGLAYQISDDITLMFDYREIYYTDVGAVSNPGNVMLPFGAKGGPGFGWDDVATLKFGLEWKTSDTMTWRFGYADNDNPDNPIGAQDVNLNILAPGIVNTHISTGFEMDMGEGDALEVAFTYVPSETVSGPGMMNPNHIVNITMDQMIFAVSWTFNMDE